MLFNSHVFIFVYLPVVFFGFFGLARYSHYLAGLWLAAASLFFYGWWDARFVGLLLASIAFNYSAGFYIGHGKAGRNRLVLGAAVAANLALLGYFKYAGFFIGSLNALFSTDFPVGEFFLPLGISFFTFTQIAFLVDTWQGKVKEFNFIHYTLFVTYFPHLIAGPVLHHKEMMPQFAKAETYRFNYDNVMVGLVIFFMGLFKKVVLADGFAQYVSPVFSATGQIGFLDAWGGALCYSLQLYFDFSGYSDMAIGLSRLFGVSLPLNFHSPYKAVNIIDFWRRWHMTLSRFLRDYLYIPLGGNRKGPVRRHVNLLLTMLLGGLWHGAGWTFVLWGGLHGLYLVINHGWHALQRRRGLDPHAPVSGLWRCLSTLLTFLAVVAAWVLFRAENVEVAGRLLRTMTFMDGLILPQTWQAKWHSLSGLGASFTAVKPMIKGWAVTWLAAGLVLVWFTPNTQQIMAAYKPALVMPEDGAAARWQWRPSLACLVLSLALAFYSILSISKLSEFIYFQF